MVVSYLILLRAVGIDVFLRRAGDVNPLIVDAGRIRGLTSPARRWQPQSSPREDELCYSSFCVKNFQNPRLR